MSRRATALGIISSVVLTVAGPMVGTENSRAQAADVGGYVIGAGLGLLLGSLLYRNNSTTSGTNYSPSYYGYGSNTTQAQPQVVYGWYNDGFSQTYGPIVVPPPGYVQPQTTTSVTGSVLGSSTPITYGTVVGANGAPITGLLVNSPTGTPGSVGTIIDPSTGATITGPLVGSPVTVTPTTTSAAPATNTPTTTTTTPTTTTPKTATPTSGTSTTANSPSAAGTPNPATVNAGAQKISSSIGQHFASLSRASASSLSRAASTVRSSAVHSAIQRVSRGSVSMIKNQAGRSLGRVF